MRILANARALIVGADHMKRVLALPLIFAFLSTAVYAETFNYSCKVDGKTHPLRVDDSKNILEWEGKQYRLTVNEDCGKYGWSAESNGTSFKFCTATQGYAAIEDKDGNDLVQCNLMRQPVADVPRWAPSNAVLNAGFFTPRFGDALGGEFAESNITVRELAQACPIQHSGATIRFSKEAKGFTYTCSWVAQNPGQIATLAIKFEFIHTKYANGVVVTSIVEQDGDHRSSIPPKAMDDFFGNLTPPCLTPENTECN